MRFLLALLLAQTVFTYPPGRSNVSTYPAAPSGAPATLLRFEATTPTGAAAGATYALNIYEAPPDDPFHPYVGSNGGGFIAAGATPAYSAAFSAGVAEVEVEPGDYWYFIFAFNGYATHGGEASPVTVSAVEGETTVVTILQADTEWTTNVKTAYNPYCSAGLVLDLGLDMAEVAYASDFWAGGALPTDGFIKVAWASGANYGDSITATCNELGLNNVNLILWSENHLYGDFCSTTLTIEDGLGMCP